MTKKEIFFPVLGFYFNVVFKNLGTKKFDNLFQSVSGLTVDLETEEITEGGENRFKHTLPVRSKYSKLVLKRGLLIDSEVVSWCKDALQIFKIKPKDIDIVLLGEDHQALKTWSLKNAFPIKWSLSDFNAEENKVVIETLELSYNFFTTHSSANNN